jgi:acyl carrier protein
MNGIIVIANLESELARFITEELGLDVDPNTIDPEAPIFGDGLGLDSIDALELGLVLSTKYRVVISPADQKNGAIFSSLRALSRYVQENRPA